MHHREDTKSKWSLWWNKDKHIYSWLHLNPLRARVKEQRTSGPVNVHLTPGPGIYFNAFIHVYSPRAGQTAPWGQNFYDNRKAFSLCLYVASFRMISSKSDFIHIFNDFKHVYSPGPRAENPLVDKLLMSTESPYHFDHCCKFQKNLFEFWYGIWLYQFLIIAYLFTFYTHFVMILHMYIAPGQGQTTFVDKILLSTEKTLSLCPFDASLKKYLWSLNLYIIFHVFIHIYISGAGVYNPPGVRIVM